MKVSEPSCMDCGKPYDEFGMDVWLRDAEWEIINPNKDGILCANCIVQRASKIPGVIVVNMDFDFRKD